MLKRLQLTFLIPCLFVHGHKTHAFMARLPAGQAGIKFGRSVFRFGIPQALACGALFLSFLSAGTIHAFDEATEQNVDGTYSAEIIWTTDKPATSQIEYTEDTSEGYNYKTEENNDLVTSHKVIIGSLKASTLYHYRVRCKDSNGHETVSKDFTLQVPDETNNKPPEISEVRVGNIIAPGLSAQTRTDDKVTKKPADDEPPSTKTIQEPETHELGVRGEWSSVKNSASSYPELKQNTSSCPIKNVSENCAVAKERPVQESLIEQGALLLPKGTLQIEPSFTYAHVSANKITIDGLAVLPILVVGEISAGDIKRDIFIPALSARYGLLKNLQWNFRVPYRFQYERETINSDTETTRASSGIGDVETGLSYQFFSERGALPGLIGGLNVKSDTGKSPYGREIGLGTGHWGIKLNMVAVKCCDPAILYGSFGYTWNIKRDINGFGKVDPGNTFDYNLGITFALNYQTAMNFQLEQYVTESLKMDGSDVADSFTNIINFKIGLTHSISRNFFVDISTGWGLTEDSPDFTMEIRFPYTF